MENIIIFVNFVGNLECDLGEVSIAPLAIWFAAQLISGIGGTLYYSLGYSYMDDNIKKSKSPVIISQYYFLNCYLKQKYIHVLPISRITFIWLELP